MMGDPGFEQNERHFLYREYLESLVLMDILEKARAEGLHVG